MVAERAFRSKMAEGRKPGRRCPIFNGEESEYENWKMQVEDWLELEEEELKYPGLELRLALKGRALRLSENIMREDLKKKGGERKLLEILDKAYRKDKRINKILKIEEYYKIQRKDRESIKEYVERYEHVARKCKMEGGGELSEEMRGWHLVVQARLDQTTQTIIVGACSAEAKYEEIKEEMLRITADREEKKEGEWMEGGRKKGRMNKEIVCYKCGEKGHISWSCIKEGTECGYCKRPGHGEKDCRDKTIKCWKCQKLGHRESRCDMREKKKEDERAEKGVDREQGRIFLSEREENEDHEYLEAIIDTGCSTSLCGEL